MVNAHFEANSLYYKVMPKQLKQTRKTRDENEVAFRLVSQSTEESKPTPSKDPQALISEYMAKLGSRGGKIGGKRRMKTMTADERSKVAKKAATARWKKIKKL